MANNKSDLIFKRKIHCDNKILMFHTHSGNYMICVRFKINFLNRDNSMIGKNIAKKGHQEGFLYDDNLMCIEF